MRIFVFCIIILFIKSHATAQVALRFTSITINEGLSQGFISNITQDKQGLIWFATGDGLNKYDGYHFVVYHHDVDDPFSIGSDDLTYVFEDSRQWLWIATRSNGLDLFDRATNRFYHIRHGGTNSLLSNNVSFISEDKEGALWITTESGIDRLEILPSQNKLRKNTFFDKYELRFTHIRSDKTVTEKTFNNIIKGSIFTDSRGRNIFVTNSNIYEITFKSHSNYSFNKKGSISVLGSNFISGILEDSKNKSYLTNSDKIVLYPDYNFQKPSTIYQYSPVRPGHLWAVDKKGGIWISENATLRHILIPGNRQFVYHAADSSQNDALRTVTCLFSDRQGVLWVGTGGYGLLKYDPEIERFHSILPGTRQYQLTEINPGVIMTNNFEQLIIKKGHPFVHVSDPFLTSLQQKFLGQNILRFAKDRNGNIWIPYGKRLYCYDLREKQERIYNIIPANKKGGIFFVFPGREGALWYGMGRQLVRFVPPLNFSYITLPIGAQDVDEDFIQDICEDGNILWIGSKLGLIRFNKNTMKAEASYTFKPEVSQSLSNNFIFSLCLDALRPQKYLWIGTKGGGLNRLDKISGTVKRYSTKDGLTNNVVYGILSDNEGNLWLSTNRGLSSFNPDKEVFRNFDRQSGLQSNEFNRYSYCKTSDGLLVFGGMNGINFFDPGELKPLNAPPVIFTDFRLFNRKVDLRNPNSPLSIDINYATEIRLKYEQNMITFQFAGMDFRRQGSIRYRYRMEGFDKDWVYSDTDHEATYTNLAPGTYTFAVQGSFEKEHWGQDAKSIRVIILTPWYRSWWFFALIFLSTLSVLYGLYRFRIYQLKRMENLRDRIARDLHDEIGSTISTISIYAKIMQEQFGAKDFDSRPIVEKISAFSSEIMESMKDIVWDINTRNDTFDRIISRMREYATQMLEPKGYRVHFDADETVNTPGLGMDKRREFFLIYKEALHNVMKYASGGNVWIVLKLHQDSLSLTIKDDGKGFDPLGVSAGNGLNNMQQRALQLKGRLSVDAQPGQGTIVSLVFRIR